MMRSLPLPRRETLPVLRGLVHPVTVAALAVWLVNDHLLKGTGPGWLTGKLSDVACLMVVPWMPVVAYTLVRPGNHLPRAWLFVSCVLTGMVMVTINVWDGAAWAYRYGLAALQWPFQWMTATMAGHGFAPLRPVALTMDPTDLLTLPALLVPLRLWREEEA